MEGRRGDQIAEAMDGRWVGEWLLEGRLTRGKEVQGRIWLLLFSQQPLSDWMGLACLLRKLSLFPLPGLERHQGFLGKEARARPRVALARIRIPTVSQGNSQGLRADNQVGPSRPVTLFCIQRKAVRQRWQHQPSSAAGGSTSRLDPA